MPDAEPAENRLPDVPTGVLPGAASTLEDDAGTIPGGGADGDTERDPVSVALATRTPVRVLLVARWSPACQLIDQAGLSVGADVVCDIDEHPSLAERHQVWSIPTLLVVDESGVRRRVTGAACVEALKDPQR